MARRERSQQQAAAISQLRHREKADEPRQPHVDRPGVDDKCTTQQRADVPMAEVVQVGADMADHPVLHLRAEGVQNYGDEGHDHRIRHGDADPCQPGE